MGACSTLYVTREKAIEKIKDCLEKCSDRELSDMLYVLIGYKNLYNFRIDHPSERVDEDEATMYHLE
jgi:hypothetical protein